METSNLSSIKLKEIVIKMFTELGRKVNEFSEDLGNKEIEKEPNRAEEYNNGNKKTDTRENHHQIKGCRRINQ